MNFLYPGVLFLSALAIIPFIIHFKKKIKRKKIYFPYLFLFESEIKGKSKRTRLEEIFLLILRVLIILLTVLFLARPYTTQDINKDKEILIFFDNTKSMLYINKSETVLNTAKRRIRQFVNKISGEMHYKLVLANGRFFRDLDKNALIEIISSAKPAQKLLQPNKAMGILQKNRDKNKSSVYLLASDFRKNRFRDFNFNNDFKYLSLSSENRRNVSIKKVFFLKRVYYKGEKIILNYTLENHSGFNEKCVLRIKQNNKTVFEKNFNIVGFGKITSATDILLKSGKHDFKFILSDDNFPYDNEISFNLKVLSGLNVYMSGKSGLKSKLISESLAPGKFKEKRNINIDYKVRRKNYHVVILNKPLIKTPKAVIATILIPNNNNSINELNKVISKQTDLIKIEFVKRNNVILKSDITFPLHLDMSDVRFKSYFSVKSNARGYFPMAKQKFLYTTANFAVFTADISMENSNFLFSAKLPVIFDNIINSFINKPSIQKNIFKYNENYLQSLKINREINLENIFSSVQKDFIRYILLVFIIFLLLIEIIIIMRRDFVKKMLVSKRNYGID